MIRRASRGSRRWGAFLAISGALISVGAVTPVQAAPVQAAPAVAAPPSSAVLLFDSTIGGVQGIYTMPLTGGTPTKIATGTQPAWAPGGTRIAYVNAAGQLVVAAANGTWSTVVPTPAGGTVTSLSWSNDGSRIAYTLSYPTAFNPPDSLHVYNLVTSTDKQVSLPDNGQLDDVRWSPTSDTVVVGDNAAYPYTYYVNVDQGTVTAPQQSFGYCCGELYDWSPDGTRLLVAARSIGGSTLESVKLDGTDAVGYSISPVSAAAFTPDGTQVIYQQTQTTGLSMVSAGSPGVVSPVAVNGVVSSLSIASVDSGASVGYALAEASGAVHTFGAFEFRGQAVGTSAHPVVGVVSTPDRGGYWLVASDGGVFSFGDARFFGSTGNLRLTRPVVGMVSTADGGGYWLVASDGGVFSFGDARFYGSTGALALVKPVVGMAATLTGHGYWLVAADGGVFTFGDAAFYGSAASVAASSKTVGVAVTPDGAGYTLLSRAGGILTFGDAGYFGNATDGLVTDDVVGLTN